MFNFNHAGISCTIFSSPLKSFMLDHTYFGQKHNKWIYSSKHNPYILNAIIWRSVPRIFQAAFKCGLSTENEVPVENIEQTQYHN